MSIKRIIYACRLDVNVFFFAVLLNSAFLLDGSSDLALAAAAEEAAREACRLSAKNIFRDRKTTAADKR